MFLDCFAAIIAGMVKNAILPIWAPDRQQLRQHCTKPWMDKDGKQRGPMMTASTFAQKPVAFFHKYCRHYTPEPDEMVRRLQDIPTVFGHLNDPSTGQLVFREDGPAMKALQNLINLAASGKLTGGLVKLCSRVHCRLGYPALCVLTSGRCDCNCNVVAWRDFGWI